MDCKRGSVLSQPKKAVAEMAVHSSRRIVAGALERRVWSVRASNPSSGGGYSVPALHQLGFTKPNGYPSAGGLLPHRFTRAL